MGAGITFVHGFLEVAAPEGDNILVLVPNRYMNELNRLDDPSWYDTADKKKILFFYPGSSPIRPVGNLFTAVAHDSWGEFEDLELYHWEPF